MGSSTIRRVKSFTLEPEVDQYVSGTKGDRSASQRVNEMLKRVIRQERYDRLEAEARTFFASAGKAERKEAGAFQAASVRSITRD